MKLNKLIGMVCFILLFSVGASFAALIDFSGYNAGDSIENQLIDGYVTITSTNNDTVVVKVNDTTYIAYNANTPTTNNAIPNGCMDNSAGFSDSSNTDFSDYTFTFIQPLSNFSLVMYDYGDWNYWSQTHHNVTLYAYDSNDTLVDSSTLDFTTDTKKTSGTSPEFGFMGDVGDACEAAHNYTQPGLWKFTVSAPQIAYTTLVFGDGVDPAVSFGLFEVELAAPPIVCEEQSYPLLAGQHIDVGNVTVSEDGLGNMSVTYTTTGNWTITETHLSVQCDEAEVSQTKKGNPIPGQFEMSETHDPSVTEYTYTFVAPACNNASDVVVAAHAVVQEEFVTEIIVFNGTLGVNYTTPFYADSVYNTSQGLQKNGSPVDPLRSVPEQGLVYETDENQSNFYSLGFGGEFIAEFTCPLFNGEGDDLRIIEDTWGTSYPLEKAEVFLSYDGVNWTSLGFADNTNPEATYGIHTTTSFDIAGLEGATFVKIVDVSNPGDHLDASDGYDLNAIEALQNCSIPPQPPIIEYNITIGESETAWSNGTRFVEKGNWATYSKYGVCVDVQVDDEDPVIEELPTGETNSTDSNQTQSQTKVERLLEKGVSGNGIETAPGLQKEKPNDNFAGGKKNKK